MDVRAKLTILADAPTARVVLVGEQPGDQEDLVGRPLIGSTGQVLDEALAFARLSRDDIYITNSVKHFHWEPQGKHRLHKKPPTRNSANRSGFCGGFQKGIHHRVTETPRRREKERAVLRPRLLGGSAPLR